MADLVMGAMPSLIPKLTELLEEEYNLQTGVKERVRLLTQELEHSQAALRKVADVPWDELDEQVKLWAREVRESSYDMEDILDTFLVRVRGRDSAAAEHKGLLKRLGEKIANLFKKSKARREISVGVKDIMAHLDEVTERCHRYKVDDIVARRPATTSMVDPRLAAMYNKVKNLVGIGRSSGELITMLQGGDVPPNAKIKVVSVVGVGGLGKTTLAKAVYDKLKGEFNHGAFVPVGRNSDLKKVIKAILIELDKERYMQFNFAQLDEIHQFINELRDFLLKNKRYFIVADDIWDIESWERIKLAIDDDNDCGGKIIITTRKFEVARKAGEVYKLQPLSYDSSRELFYTRMTGDQGCHVNNQEDEISYEILKKCGGIPLAIITMASLLVGKPRDKWSEIYKTIGFGSKDSRGAENTTMKILSYSYYDLPSHLRTCLLYLSAFREDSVILKGPLIWKWVAEGFILKEPRTWIFDTGEGYFNDLMNRSLVQAVEHDDFLYGTMAGCRVHDIVLDFIRSMSHDENFFIVQDDSDQEKPLQGHHVRRLAHLDRTTMQHSHNKAEDDSDVMRTVRSFSAQGCTIESWVILSSFTLLRVLAIEDCSLTDGCRLRIKHVGDLPHLRYLSLSGTRIDRVPKEIENLKFLQTLDLRGSKIVETPSLPTKLVCLHISFGTGADTGVDWMERLASSLEELLLIYTDRFLLKELGSLGELRVLTTCILVDDETNRDFVKSVSRLKKLQHLSAICLGGLDPWEAGRLSLPRQLRHFSVQEVSFVKLPRCINPSSLTSLCHLDLSLQDVDERDLKNLGGLPELRFLRLELYCSGSINSINDDDDNNVVYFPKMRCCKLPRSMFLFVANKESVISFHVWEWDGSDDDIAVPFDDEVVQGGSIASSAAASGDENNKEEDLVVGEGDGKGKGKGAWRDQKTGSFDDEVLQGGSIASAATASRDENSEEPVVGEGKGKGKGAAAAPCCFMPSLQELDFVVCANAKEDPRYFDYLGWEYLPSLREIKVSMGWLSSHDDARAKMVEKLRRAADAHPNRPALLF